MENQQPPLTSYIGPKLRLVREARNLTLKGVAEGLVVYGVTVSVNTLSKLERSDRVPTLEEIVALSRLLNVPPVYLLLPIGQLRTVDVPSSDPVPVMGLLKWFTGEQPWGSWEPRERSLRSWYTQDSPTGLAAEDPRQMAFDDSEWADVLQHEALVSDLEVTRWSLMTNAFGDTGGPQVLRQLIRSMNTTGTALRDLRRRMAGQGFVPPVLPDWLEDPSADSGTVDGSDHLTNTAEFFLRQLGLAVSADRDTRSSVSEPGTEK